MKDPFEAAAVEEEESPPESPIPMEEEGTVDGRDDEKTDGRSKPSTSAPPLASNGAPGTSGVRGKEEEEEDEEDNVDVQLGKFPPSGDPDKMAKMQTILSQFTEEQMSRYESFRRSGFQRSNMKRLLGNIIGSQKVSMPVTIVVSGIAKMFVGELIETSRVVMTERKESGPIRPCHIRETYRRLKLEGKIPRRSVRRLFR